MASNKKKQDEENLRILREMVALLHNKHCFDCNQRGPTYINMTIGSFVCTSCSGLLRGLNPPHRVKSISMASFTSEEMEFIKSRGNAFCQKVWLGLYDMRSLPSVDARDEVKMREMMAQRYEKKRWYVQPTDSMYEEARKQNTSISVVTSKPLALARPVIASVQSESSPAVTQSIQRPLVSSASPQPVISDQFLVQANNQSQLPSAPSIPNKVDLLTDFGGDPFAGPTMPSKSTDSTDGFANFAVFSSQTSTASVGSSSGLFHKPTGLAANFSSSSSASPFAPPVPADKYSALAELESAFLAPVSTPATVNWDSLSGGGSMIGGVAPTVGASSWGSGGLSSSAGSSNSFGVGGPPVGGSPFYGGSLATGPSSSSVFNVTGVGAAASFAVPAVNPNPFGQPQIVSYPQAVANPFVVAPNYSQPVAVGMGPVHPTAAVNQFGIASASASNQVGMVNGRAWNVQQPAALAQVPPQQVTTAWGQPAAFNPFMSNNNLPARSASVTNPFL